MSACVPSCSGRGRFVNNTMCVCDEVYAGENCEVDLIKRNLLLLAESLPLEYNETLTMHKQEVVLSADRTEGMIPLPEGTTHNRTAGDFYKVDFRLYQLLPEDDDAFLARRRRKGQSVKAAMGTCAIVGNSGALLYRQYGVDIDAHDVVYRFNQAPVEGYESHVGARTTLENLNSAWMKHLLETPHSAGRWNWRKPETALVIFEMFDPASMKFKTREQIAMKDKWWKKSYERLRARRPDKNVVVLSPRFMAWATALYSRLKLRFQKLGLGTYTGEKPMSGFYAILWTLQVCDRVDLYGFTPYRDEDRAEAMATRYHYFDSAVPRAHSHSFDLTRHIYQLLAYRFPHFNMYD
eukprot:1186642-Prorocentrum_minimum.AAC.1